MDLNLGQGASTGGLSYKGLQLYHNYNSDATDKSLKKSNHGVMHTGRSLYFDGSLDYVDLGTQATSTSITFAGWVNPFTTNNDGIVTWGRFHVRIKDSIAFTIWSDTWQTSTTFDNLSFQINNWMRVVVTQTGTDLTLYIDGESQGTQTAPATSQLETTTSSIGAYNNGSNPFQGELSNVQIWDKAWTADDVAYDYANVQATPNDIATNSLALSVANCRTWLPMTEGADTTLYDGGVVLGDETVTNTAITDWDLSADSPELVDNGTFTDDLSGWTAGWDSSHDSVNKRLIPGYGSYQDVSVTSGVTYRVKADINLANSYTQFYLGHAGDASAYLSITTTGLYEVDELVTPNTSIIRVYCLDSNSNSWVDNVSIKQVVSASSTYDTGTLSIGASNTISQDDVYEGTREYLTELDVSAYTGTVEVQDGAGTTLHTVSATGEQSFLTTGNGTTDNLQVVASASSSATIDNISVKEVQPKENGTAYDGDTTGDGVLTGATWKAGVIGSEVETPFDGSDDYVTTDESAQFDYDIDDSFSLSAWVYNDSTNTDGQIVFKSETTVKSGYWLRQDGANLRFNFSKETAQLGNVSASNVFSTKKLRLVTATYDGSSNLSGAKLYVDGVLVETGSASAFTGSMLNNQKMLIGSEISYEYFTGNIHNTAIFDHALTSTEVSELYALGKAGDVTGHSQAIDEYVDDTNLVDADASTFEGTSTYNWIPYGLNTIENVNNQLVITGVDDVNGVYWYLRDTFDLTKTLIPGTKYRLTYDAKYSGEVSAPFFRVFPGGGSSVYQELTTTMTTYGAVFTCVNNDGYINFDNTLSNGAVVTIDNIKLEEYAGDHLVGYWKNTGVQKWDDLSGNDNHGTFKNHVFGNIPQTGLMSYNKPMLFDGTDDYVDSTGITADEFSITCTALKHSGVSYYPLWNISCVEGTTNGQLSLHGSGTRLEVLGGSIDSNIGNGLTDKLMTITMTYDGTVFRRYEDGELVVGTISITGLSLRNNYIQIGNFWGGKFKGYINEVSIFDTALTADEVSELYGNGTPLDATTHSKVDNLQGYWRNDGDDVWVDRTPVLGAELVTNGDFTTNTDGWTPSKSSLSVEGGRLKVTVNDTSNNHVSATSELMAVTAGSTYIVKADIENGTQTGGLGASYYDSSQNYHSLAISRSPYVGTGSHEWVLTIPSGVSYMNTYADVNETTLGEYAYFDNVSVKEVKGGNDGTVSGSPETILLPEARNGRDTLGFPINNVNNGYLALHGDGYVEVADDDYDLGAEDFTLEAWVRPRDFSVPTYIFGKRITSSYRWYLMLNTTGRIDFYSKYDTDVGVTLGGVTEANLNEWLHVVLTADRDGYVKSYVNGSLDDTETANAVDISNTANLGIGVRNIGHDSNVIADIDEPRIYNRSLTEVEVLQNYNAGKSKHRND